VKLNVTAVDYDGSIMQDKRAEPVTKGHDFRII
jgi:hypothetical protein